VSGNVSNPAQNGGPCHVIVRLSEIESISRTGKGEIDGTVSSFSSSAAGFVTGITSKVAVEIQTADPGSSITKDVPILRADHAAGQARLSGVREVDQRRFP
jgi:hypothetical protein